MTLSANLPEYLHPRGNDYRLAGSLLFLDGRYYIQYLTYVAPPRHEFCADTDREGGARIDATW